MGKTLGYGEITVANMTEPFTVMLTNEAQQFATDSNRKVTSAQSYYTDIIVIRGSQERTDYTIGNITSGSGITVSKNSKRVTFSVSAGTTIGADAGVIEIPITLDGQTVKKQFSWSCGKQGPQGVKGDPGTSVKITSKSVTYQTSTSGTTAPTGTWSTTVPTVNNGQYLWTKTTVQYSDGNKTEAYSVSYKGTNGTNGTSVTVSKTEVTYQVSTSGTTAPTGTWSATMPSCDQGLYLWTKTYVKYSDGKDTTSYSVSYKGVDGEKFAFNMLRETNQGSKHWGNHASGGKYSVESTTTEDGINAVKIITTEAIPSNGWHYVTFADYKMLKSLTPSTTYTLSFDIWSNQGNHYEWITIQQGSATNAMTSSSFVQIQGNENWQHTTTTLTTVALMPEIASQCIYMTGTSAIGYAIIKNLKLTEGAVDTPWAPHPEDLEGRGVSQTVQYYLATSQASGVTSSTSGWSTDITTQKLTADKKYLWNCYQTKYSDGTSEPISTPKVIGVYGDKGQKGENAKNLSITPSSQYFKSTDGGKTFAPNTITIKPTIQGEINFGKWQYSIDGGVSFADAVSGQKGLTISNNVLTVSKDSSLYSDAVTMVTFRAVASDSSFYDTCSIAKIYDVSDIGDGRNLWITRDNITLQACEKDKYIYTTTGTSAVCIGADGSSVGTNTIALQTGTKYTISFVISSPSEVGNALWYFCTALNSTGVKNYGGYGVKLVTGENIVSQTITVDTSCDAAGLVIYNLPTDCIIKDIQVEKGSSPTGWTPAPEDVQTAILSTKSEISDVSLKVDNNKQAIEQRVEKTTYQQDLKLVKGDISKANEGLNKWRYEIYPKSLFTDKPEDQRKISLDVFARNKNIIPTQSILLDDTKLGHSNYDDNYIGYAVTFVKMSEATKLETTFVHDDAGSFYLNGQLICTNGTNNFYSSATPDTVSCTLVKGWNCLEVVINEGNGSEGFKFGTVLSQLSTCQLMNCYYAMVTGRESQITNTLVQNTIDIEGVSTKVGKVTSVIGENGENFTSFENDYSDFKQTMNGFKTTVGQTYVTKDDFNGLEIGGRNLLWNSGTTTAIQNSGEWNAHGCTATAETRNNCLVSRVNSHWNGYQFNLKKIIERYNLVDGDILTYSIDVKMDEPIDILFVNNYYADNKGCTGGISTVNRWDGKYFTIGKWERLSFTFKITQDTLDKIATDTYRQGVRTAFEPVKATSEGKYVYFACPKLERGTKATDYTPALEDNEINGQNLVSNLPSNWEQGSINYTANLAYGSLKSTLVSRLRTKDVFPVSGNITISAGTSTNSSKEELNFYYVLFDINKKSISHGDTWQSLTSPKIINCGDAKYMAIILRWGSGSTAITPSDISQICLKIERGTSATPFTLAPEDVNGKIVNVETIANQTAKKFEWIVKGESTSSNLVLTDNALTAIANNINLTGKVTFNSFDQSLKDNVSTTSGNLITITPANPKSEYDSVAYTVDISDRGEKCIKWTTANSQPYLIFTSYYTPNIFRAGDRLYYDLVVPNWSSTITTGLGVWFYDKNKTYLSNKLVNITLTGGRWNHITGYIDMPVAGSSWNNIYYYNLGIENKSKAIIGLCSGSYIEKTNSYATTYSSNAVNWVTNNGSSTTSLNSMVKKWTDGAVSDTTQINGGWLKANTITASKIAVGDFTNYADINESNTYGFTVEKTTDGVWFSKNGAELGRDNHISEYHECEPGQQFRVEYDLSNTIKEGDTYKDAGIMLFGYDGTKTIKCYQRNASVAATADGTTTHISSMVSMPSGIRFFRVVLQIEGHAPFTGTLKIRNISVRKATTGKLIVDGSITADKIATDAIKSRNYISSGGAQGSFLNLSDGSFTSPNLSWDSNGNLIAKNANLSGQITATIGSIGGWNIGDTSLFTGITKSNVRIYDAVNADNAQNMYQKEQHSLILANTYINSFNSSLNSSDNYWHAQGVTINDGEFQVGETLYNPNLVNSDKDEVYYDRGLTRVFGGYITMSRDCSINSDSRSLYADIILNGEELYICTNRNILFSPLRTSIFTTEDPSKYNAIETTGDAIIGGNMVLRDRSNGNHKVAIYPYDGCIEMYGNAPYIDFHYGSTTSDYTSRIIAQSGWDCLTFTGSILLGGDIYNSSNGHYTWDGKTDAYLGCGNYSGGNNIYYYANYHAFYVNNDLGSGMMYINTNGVTSRVGFTKTSDERIKKNFESFDDNIIDAYMNIEPVKYQLKQSSNDNYHFGFKAQHIDKIFSDYGDTYNESFDICTSRPIDPDKAKELYGVDGMVEEYGLRYDELIAPTTYMVQHIYKELEQVKQEKADLETRLQAIEAKLRL